MISWFGATFCVKRFNYEETDLLFLGFMLSESMWEQNCWNECIGLISRSSSSLGAGTLSIGRLRRHVGEIVKVKGFVEINLKWLLHCPQASMDTVESSDSAVPVAWEAGRALVLWAASQAPPLSRVPEAGSNATALGPPETLVAQVAPLKSCYEAFLFCKIKGLDEIRVPETLFC